LLCYREGIVRLDAETPDCAFNLGVAEQGLGGGLGSALMAELGSKPLSMAEDQMLLSLAQSTSLRRLEMKVLGHLSINTVRAI
jgi:hypothetical protein